LTESLLPAVSTTPEPCNAGKSYCSIGPTGDLMPCILMPVVVGNLRERKFAELWYGDPLFERLHAIEKADLHACASCDVAHECSRCPGLAVQRGQDIDGCDLSGKQVAKARIDARMRLRVV
jgi:radical SAM protein with 4Fe4S-binding SPASM domain